VLASVNTTSHEPDGAEGRGGGAVLQADSETEDEIEKQLKTHVVKHSRFVMTIAV